MDIRGFLSKEDVRIDHTHKDENLVDYLTKWLTRKEVLNTPKKKRLFPLK